MSTEVAPPVDVPGRADRGGRSSGVTALAVAVVALLALRQVYIVPFTGLGLSPAQLIFLAGAVLWLFLWLGRRHGTPGVFALRVALGLVLATDAIAYGVAMARGTLAADQIAAADLAMRDQLLYAAVVIVVLETVRTWAGVELLVKCLVFGGAVSAFAAVLRSVVGFDLASRLKLPGLRVLTAIDTSGVRNGVVRPQGTAGHPLELAAVMTVLIPVAIGLVGTLLRRREHCRLWVLATVLLVCGAAVSLSRLALIGTVVAVVIVMTRWPVARTAWLIVFAFIATAFQMISNSKVVTALADLITNGSQDNSLASRSGSRTWVFDHLTAFFTVGSGPGTSAPDQPVLDNEYLLRLVHTGVFGLAALVLLALTAPVLALHAAHLARGHTRELAVGIAGGLVALVLCYAVLDVEAFPQISLVASVLTGLAARAVTLARADARAAEVGDRDAAVAARY